MSEAYERERQNNARLEELSSKVSALRGVTIDIYDSARQQDMIDSTVRFLSLFFFALLYSRPCRDLRHYTISPPNTSPPSIYFLASVC